MKINVSYVFYVLSIDSTIFNYHITYNVKPLSHQGGVLVAFSRRSTKMQNAKVNAVRAPWTPWQRGGNSIERRGKS